MEQKMRHLSLQPRPIRYTLLFVSLAAALAGFGGALLALYFFFHNNLETSFSDKLLFACAAGLAALIVGPLFWWKFVIKPDRITRKRGVAIGILGSIIAHPLAWFFADILCYFTGRPMVIGLFQADTPLLAVFSCLIYSIFSLIYVGWLTALIGGFAGAAFVYAQQRSPVFALNRSLPDSK